MNERRNIFAYTPPDSNYPPYISINREADGSVTVTVRDGSATAYGVVPYKVAGPTATITVPAPQLQKLVAAFALEPDLWPGCDCDIKAARAEVGKPHGGPVQ